MTSVFCKPTILIVGAYPPPIGGNSIHIERLHALLVMDGFDVNIIDLYGSRSTPASESTIIRNGPPGLLCLLRSAHNIRSLDYDVVHFHVSGMLKFLIGGAFLLALVPERAKKVITIHSGSFSTIATQLTGLRLLSLRHLLQKFDVIITVSTEQRDAVEAVSGRVAKVIPAFLPNLKPADNSWRDEVRTLRASYTKVIVSSGYGIPLYGYEQILKALKGTWQKRREKVALVLCIYNDYDEAYLERLSSEASADITLIFYRERSPEQFNHLLGYADVYVRATHSDGDAVAIREANALGVPVVASTAVKRPDFCLLYPLNDITELRQQLECALRQHAGGPANANGQTYYQEILHSYDLGLA